MSNLVYEILLRAVKPLAAALIGLLIYFVATSLGEPGSVSLALVSFLSAAALILLIQESPL
jgi:hypothetical protein